MAFLRRVGLSSMMVIILGIQYETRAVNAEAVSQVARNIATFAVITALTTIVHEWGHALAAMSLINSATIPQIHIGTCNASSDPSQILFSFGNMHFHKTYRWDKGVTQFNYSTNEPNISYKLGVVTVAGGVSAAIFLFGALTAIMAYCDYCDGKSVSTIGIYSLQNALTPFNHIARTRNLSPSQRCFLLYASQVMSVLLWNNLFYAFTPIFEGDGTELWRNHIGLSENSIIAFRAASCAAFGVCCYMLWHNYFRAANQTA